MRFADFLVLFLREIGVQRVFGVTGRGSLFLTDGLARDGIPFHPMLHEQSAGFAANAAASATGAWSCCIASSGVGATNLVTPLLNAWQDELPVVALTGQNMSHSSTSITQSGIRTYGDQETDLIPIFSSICKLSIIVSNGEDFVSNLPELMRQANSGRPGPFHIDVPLDIQSSRISRELADRALIEVREVLNQTSKPFSESKDSSQVLTAREEADSFFDSCGSGKLTVLLGPNFERLVSPELIEKLCKSKSSLVLEPGANSKVNSTNKLGVVSFLAGGYIANKHLLGASHILAIGSSFRSHVVSFGESLISPNAEVLHIDFDNLDVSPHLQVKKFIHIPSSRATENLISDYLDSSKVRSNQNIGQSDSQKRHFTPAEPIDLLDLAENLQSLMPAKSNVVVDSGLLQLIVSGRGKFGANQKLFQPHSQGSMGACLAMAFGACLSSEQSTVAIIGDGSLLMNPQDLLTIANSNLPITVIVVENDLYAIIRKRQQQLFRKRTIGTDMSDGLPQVSVLELCRGSGIETQDQRKIVTPEKWFIDDVSQRTGPKVILVKGKPDQPYPRYSVDFSNKGTPDIAEEFI